MTLITNIFGGPGAGKSTISAGVFYKMKMSGLNCELVTEVAKDFTWEKRYRALKNQALVFGKQLERLDRLIDQVDVIVTDSPLPLSSIYAPEDYPKSFHPFILDMFNRMNNINFFVNRIHRYDNSGRKESEHQAKIIDEKTKEYLVQNNVPFFEVDGNPAAIDLIFDTVRNALAKQQKS